jgi:hypothetical protein
MEIDERIAGMFFTGITAGTILFSIIRTLRGRYAFSLGLALGIVMGVPAELIRSSCKSDSQHGALVERGVGPGGCLTLGCNLWLGRSATPGLRR